MNKQQLQTLKELMVKTQEALNFALELIKVAESDRFQMKLNLKSVKNKNKNANK